MSIRNRWFLLFSALASLTLVAAVACSSGTSSSDKTATAAAGGGGGATAEATTSGGGPSDAAPASDQNITIAFGAEPEFYDPHRSNFEQDIAVERMLFRGLYNLTDDGSGGVKVVPDQAADMPTVNGSVYTIKLKSGLKWSDGQPVTAGDFVYGIQRECDPDVASPYQYVLGAGLGELKGCDELFTNTDATQKQALTDALGVKAVDDTTLEVTLNKPIQTFATIWSLWATFPSRKDIIEKYGDKWTDPGNIVVNGPFTISELVLKDHVTLTPNGNWGGQTPLLQKITIKFIDNLADSLKAFQNNEEVQMTRIQPTDVSVVKGDSSLADQLIIDPTARITAVEVQMKDPVLSKFDVRLALSRAINREELVNAVYDGVFSPATYWVVKGLKGFQGNDAFDSTIGFDVTAAQKALSDAGYPNGDGFPTVTLTLTDRPDQRNLADYLVKAWKDNLNITVTPQFVDGKTRSQRFNSEDFQLFPGGWQLDYPDIENPLVGLFNTGGGNNKYNCSDPDVDAGYAEAAAATTDDARIAAYQKVETAIVTKLCGIIPIYQNAEPYMVSSKIGGVVANGTLDSSLPGTYNVENWYVKK